MDRKATLRLPSCTHALCHKCWNKIAAIDIHARCPWCRRVQHRSLRDKIMWEFAKLHPIAQGLIIFGIWKLIVR
jgi:hypothetical protein